MRTETEMFDLILGIAEADVRARTGMSTKKRQALRLVFLFNRIRCKC
jgi:hypothetical protein